MTNKLNRKISIIGGAGNIGLNIAEILSIHKKICNEIVILDISENQAKGRAIDLSQGGGIFGTCPEIKGTSNFEDISNSDIIIIPAGMPRKPGMTREDLVSINLEIMKKIGENIKKYSPNSFIIVITNPLDIMVYALQKIIGCDKKKIVGMAGALDGARFSFQLSKYFGIGAEKISSMVIGAHNDSMVVLPRHSSICGIPVSEFVQNEMISEEELSKLIEKTKTGGAEIVGLLGNGSAAFNPAACAVSMASSVLNNERSVFSCSTLLEGEYGFSGLFVGAPVILGFEGVEKIIELNLNEKEKNELHESVKTIEEGIKNLKF